MVELHDIIAKEETFWRQRSRKVFLKEGDRNTKFFHVTTLKHKMAHRICRLKTDEGSTEDEETIKREAMSFFKSLLQESNLDLDKQDSFLHCIPSCVSTDQNSFLTSIPSNVEISQVVFSFEDDKALGLDGFLLFFFQKY